MNAFFSLLCCRALRRLYLSFLFLLLRSFLVLLFFSLFYSLLGLQVFRSRRMRIKSWLSIRLLSVSNFIHSQKKKEKKCMHWLNIFLTVYTLHSPTQISWHYLYVSSEPINYFLFTSMIFSLIFKYLALIEKKLVNCAIDQRWDLKQDKLIVEFPTRSLLNASGQAHLILV